jgi:hypothetical protein
MFTSRQSRTSRNVPGVVLTLAEQAAIADPSRYVNLQEIQQLRRSHGTLASLPSQFSPGQTLRDTEIPANGYRATGYSASSAEIPAAFQATLPVQPVAATEKIAKRIPKHEKLSADLSRPVSMWDDKYHAYVHYPRNRQMPNITDIQTGLAQTAVAPDALATAQSAGSESQGILVE